MRCARCERDFEQKGFVFCPYDGHRLQKPGKRVEVSTTAIEGHLLSDRYRVRGFFAKGAMARVYLAEDEISGDLVAVKMLERRLAEDPEIRERFLREAQAIRQIQHEHIVKIHEVGLSGDRRPYMIMDFLFGESVGEHLKRECKMDRAMALSVLSHAAEALWAAHQHGIVHRDVKPDNIYLVGDPDTGFSVRLLDFGLSRLWRSDLTKSGSVIGTPSYMSPEQACADPTDQRTDVYALGLVMYRMLAGRLPFVTNDEREMVAAQLLRRPPPPTRFNADIDPQLELVIMTAINKRPDQRYPSMQLMNRDLKQLARQPLGEAALWARERSDDGYPLDSANARFAGSAFREFLR